MFTHIADIILSTIALLTVIGNTLPADNKAGQVIRAIVVDARALIAALK